MNLWDIRLRRKIRSYNDSMDYISDFVFENNDLLVTSGDGCLAYYDIRQNKAVTISDNQDDGLMCISTARVLFNLKLRILPKPLWALIRE